MRKALAFAWLVIAVLASLHVGLTAKDGLPLETDLTALLPAEDRDPMIQRAKAAVARDVSQRVVLMVGHSEAHRARAAAGILRAGLVEAKVIDVGGDVPGPEALGRLGQAYFAHRGGLLSDADYRRLEAGQAEEIVTRALSQIYGIGGIADARMLAADPFLLFPAFLAALPVPASRLAMEDGWPTTRDDGVTWVLVTARLTGEPFALEAQKGFRHAYERALAGAATAAPGVKVLRLGAVFFAEAGASRAMGESALIGGVSVAGTILLLVVVFRSSRPLLLSMTAIGIGLACGLSASLLLFGRLHAAVLIFGAGLIGVAVDYSLHYFAQVFGPSAGPRQRMRHILPGLSLGLATTLIGYLALAAAPLPGLRQVAVFSAVGLAAAFVTVLVWFPLFDRMQPRMMPAWARGGTMALWRLWGDARLSGAVVAILAGAAIIGGVRFAVDDDVRRQQALDATLVAEQEQLQRLAGFAVSGQFFLIQAPDTEAALVMEERLAERLADLKAKGAVAGWRSPASFVPSGGRQAVARRLVAERLEAAHLESHLSAIGMSAAPLPHPDGVLLLTDLLKADAMPLLPSLVLGDGLHIIGLEDARDIGALKEAAAGLDGVRFIDPVGDFGDLLATYRERAMWLLAVSALLMLPLLIWRYGIGGGVGVIIPPIAAVILSPLVLAALGIPFTFFGAMALVLVLSIGVDYAVFCAEAGAEADPVTMLAVGLATVTTVLSFGLLSLSEVAGVKSFGAMMLTGIVLAFVLSPLASRFGRAAGGCVQRTRV